MASSTENLVRKTRNELKMRPVLPLGAPISIGSVGVVVDGAFEPRGRVEGILGVQPAPTESGAHGDVELTSGRDVTITIKAVGEQSDVFPMLPVDEAFVEVALKRDESFLLAATHLKITRLRDPDPLLNAMVGAHERGTWRPEYALVYEIGVAGDLTVMAARSGGTTVALGLSGGIPAAGVRVADLAAGFNYAAQTHDLLKYDASNVTAFYNAFKVDESIFGTTIRTATFVKEWQGLDMIDPSGLADSAVPVTPM